ncbi:MAG: CapA family protein [Eubacteriales bacterium]|nr:CapA family protein [Eubacteriales bacterium]
MKERIIDFFSRAAGVIKNAAGSVVNFFASIGTMIANTYRKSRARRKKEVKRRRIQKKRLSPQQYKVWLRKRKLKNAKAISIMTATFLVLLLLLVGGVKAVTFVGTKVFSRKEPIQIVMPEITATPYEVKDISIGSTGCMLFHGPVIESGRIGDEDKFDFTDIYKYITAYYSSPDYMTCEFEGVLLGYDYSGYPNFHTPDEAIDAIKGSGVDLQLLASNHMYDGGNEGFRRTMQVLDEKGVTYGGVRKDETVPRYTVADIDGIKVGFVNYVYQDNDGIDDSNGVGVNGIAIDASDVPLTNTFNYEKLDAFYSEMQTNIDGMKADGAQFIVACMHWGEEYQLQENATQDAMAQKLCDMGVNALIGGHPHCEQPTDVFESTDGSSKMLCVFSVGNALSNQRRDLISEMPSGHTEDGVVALLNLHQDVYGEVTLTGVELLPTWVYLNDDGKYYILPLDDVKNIETTTGISGIKESAQASFDRTMDVMKNGLALAKQTFGEMETVGGITIKTKRDLPANPVSGHKAASDTNSDSADGKEVAGPSVEDNDSDDYDDSYDSYDDEY